MSIDGIIDVHHIHIWIMDNENHYATMHIVANGDIHEIKENVREELKEHGICHVTLELEKVGEHCECRNCHTHSESTHHHRHHHHHH